MDSKLWGDLVILHTKGLVRVFLLVHPLIDLEGIMFIFSLFSLE